MKGIVLAGGTGTRLFPVTRVVSKHLLPVYDKPMIYYPVSSLMLAGIREVLVIASPTDLPNYRTLLGDGSDLGLRLTYAAQAKASGIADALLIGREFIGRDAVALILGDNILYGQGVSGLLQGAVRDHLGATIFGYYVKDPRAYGVASFDSGGTLVDLEEKPSKPKSNWAVVGLYLYDAEAVEIAAAMRPSKRGELEITDLNKAFLAKRRLRLVKFGRGAAWFDAGTPQALLEASSFIATIEHRQGLKIACLEEIAYRMGFIDRAQLASLAKRITNDEYRSYLEEVLEETDPFVVTRPPPASPPRPRA